MAIGDRSTDIIRRLHRTGMSPRAISIELRNYNITLNASQVRLIISNISPGEDKGDPPLAALDAVITAHALLHEVQIRKADAIEAMRIASEADDKLTPLDVRNRCHATSAQFDAQINNAINAINRATAAYVASGGTRDEIDRVLQVHFHTSEPGTSPTPTPGVSVE